MFRHPLVVTLAIFVSSCANRPSQGKQTEAADTNKKAANTKAPDAETADTETENHPTKQPKPKSAVNCVAQCIASRQMQATSVDQIERDCESGCAAHAQDLDGQ